MLAVLTLLGLYVILKNVFGSVRPSATMRRLRRYVCSCFCYLIPCLGCCFDDNENYYERDYRVENYYY